MYISPIIGGSAPRKGSRARTTVPARASCGGPRPRPIRSRAPPGEDGRGESIWDRFSHTPGRVRNGDTGDVACDHYHRYREDVALMADLGLGAYRLSVSWPRVLPEGTGAAERSGPRLLRPARRRAARARHRPLRDALPLGPAPGAGGRRRLARPRRPRDAFGEYAALVAGRLGDRVRHFATLNEPHIVSDHGYRVGSHAPGRTEPRSGARRGAPSAWWRTRSACRRSAPQAPRRRGGHRAELRAEAPGLAAPARPGGRRRRARPVQPLVPRPDHGPRLPRGGRARMGVAARRGARRRHGGRSRRRSTSSA